MENTIDYKLGKISSDIDSLRRLHEEDKHVRDENHAKIAEMSEAMVELKQLYLRLDSWKNGQTIYMHETTDKIQKIDLKVENYKDNFNERLRPIEDDFKARTENSKENKEGWISTKFGLIQLVVMGVFIAVLSNVSVLWETFIHVIRK